MFTRVLVILFRIDVLEFHLVNGRKLVAHSVALVKILLPHIHHLRRRYATLTIELLLLWHILFL